MKHYLLAIAVLIALAPLALCSCNRRPAPEKLGDSVVMPEDWPVPELTAPPGAKPALYDRIDESGKYKHISRYLPTELGKQHNPRITHSIAIAFTTDLRQDEFFDFVEEELKNWNLVNRRHRSSNGVYSFFIDGTSNRDASLHIAVEYNRRPYYDYPVDAPAKICSYDITFFE